MSCSAERYTSGVCLSARCGALLCQFMQHIHIASATQDEIRHLKSLLGPLCSCWFAGVSASQTVNAQMQQSALASSSTVELARPVAVAAVAKVLMQMVLPVLLKMSKAAVRKTLQDKQVSTTFLCQTATKYM